jgi:predicted DNA binding CopG/RHH family protein
VNSYQETHLELRSNKKGLEMADEQKENKENLIALRLNNEQMLAVRQWAHQHNANVSQVIRSAIELMTGAKQ